ncbi:MAG: FeS-binding protein [Chloroflexi bacterium]|nr:FeS-binding protein [Chloroflexota bacterium]
MNEPVVRLVYPPDLLRAPVLNQLIRRFDITVNILRAQVGSDAGWIELQLRGDEEMVEKALDWLREKGVYVQFVEST